MFWFLFGGVSHSPQHTSGVPVWVSCLVWTVLRTPAYIHRRRRRCALVVFTVLFGAAFLGHNTLGTSHLEATFFRLEKFIWLRQRARYGCFPVDRSPLALLDDPVPFSCCQASLNNRITQRFAGIALFLFFNSAMALCCCFDLKPFTSCTILSRSIACATDSWTTQSVPQLILHCIKWWNYIDIINHVAQPWAALSRLWLRRLFPLSILYFLSFYPNLCHPVATHSSTVCLCPLMLFALRGGFAVYYSFITVDDDDDDDYGVHWIYQHEVVLYYSLSNFTFLLLLFSLARRTSFSLRTQTLCGTLCAFRVSFNIVRRATP